MKKTIRDLEINGKKVFLRVDFNVPLNEELEIVDDTRIKEALPTINYLLENGAKVIVCSHLGRPDGKVVEKMSLKPVKAHLQELIGREVLFAEDVKAKNLKTKINKMQAGDIMLLENIRFYEEEEKNDEMFSKYLSSLADIFVNDAFGATHRKHSSTYGIAKFLPSAVGFLIEKELVAFDKVLNNAEKPFVAILGGAKITDKIPVVENLLDKVDTILIGGGMSFTFIKAMGGEIGNSLLDEGMIDKCKETIEKAKEKGVEIVLPVDNRAVKEISEDAKVKKYNSALFNPEYQGVDIGPKTIKKFKKYIKGAKTIVWNGPVGVYEIDKFKKGTNSLAKAIAKSQAYSIIGGGDSVAAVQDLGITNKISHISTGGGAGLNLLKGSALPCVEIINEKE